MKPDQDDDRSLPSTPRTRADAGARPMRRDFVRSAILGGLFMLVGVAIGAVILATWIAHGFGSLSDERAAVIAATLLIVGIQIFFSSFLLSILGLRRGSGG